MAILQWDKTDEKFYQTGVDRGVLYVYNTENGLQSPYGPGIAWNGLTAVTEKPSGADSKKKWANNGVYANLRGKEEFGGTIEAFWSPEEFDECDGTIELIEGVKFGQQYRKSFGFCFRSLIGNDTDGLEHGYKLHLIYGATSSPTERKYDTVNESPDISALSWSFDTIPMNIVINDKQTSTSQIVIDSTQVAPAALTALENALYGTSDTEPYMPLPNDILSLIRTNTPTTP